jgi:hypothetical protein
MAMLYELSKGCINGRNMQHIACLKVKEKKFEEREKNNKNVQHNLMM